MLSRLWPYSIQWFTHRKEWNQSNTANGECDESQYCRYQPINFKGIILIHIEALQGTLSVMTRINSSRDYCGHLGGCRRKAACASPKVHDTAPSANISKLKNTPAMAEVQTPPPVETPTLEAYLNEPEPSASTDLVPAATSEQVITTTNAEGKRVKKIIRRKRRPARPQVDPATFKTEAPPPTGTIFNIWYNKWSGGDREDKYLSQTAAQGRCNVAKDSGYTKADKTPGSFFCLFFARGICPKGQDCE